MKLATVSFRYDALAVGSGEVLCITIRQHRQGTHAIEPPHVRFHNEDIFAYEEHEIPLNCGRNKAFNARLAYSRDPFNFHPSRVLGPHTFVLFTQCY